MSQSEPSVFTRIINREIPADILFENEKVIAIRDLHPQAKVHILVIPKLQVVSIHDLTADRANTSLLWELFETCRVVAEQEGIAESGYRLLTNTGPDADQSVHHLHIHLLGGEALRSEMA